MSFDLGVWSSSKPMTSEEAIKIYVALCENGDTSAIVPQAESEQNISDFLEELTHTYPQIDDYSDDDVDDCPWSCAFDESDVHVIMPMVWSRVEEVAPLIISLASKHELICFNPQADTVMLPPSLRP